MNTDLRRELRDLHAELSAEMRQRWARDLPLGELLSDRWERAKALGFGEGSSIYAESYVYGDIRVGTDVWIGPFTLLDGSGGLEIGDGTTISAGVHIYTHDTVMRTLSGGSTPTEHSPVVIGPRVYVGAQSVIAKGVTVGELSVIGAMSFVNRDLPPYAIAAGIPARQIGRVVLQDNGDVALEY